MSNLQKIMLKNRRFIAPEVNSIQLKYIKCKCIYHLLALMQGRWLEAVSELLMSEKVCHSERSEESISCCVDD